MNVRRQFLLSLLAASLFPHAGGAQGLPTDVCQAIGRFLDTTARKEISVGRLTAYALKNGKKLWSFESGKRIVGTPAVSEGIVVFGSADRHIYGLNAKDGNLPWTVKAAEPVLGAVTIANGTAYIGASDATFRAIDIHTGNTVWRTFQSMVRETIGLSEDGERIYSKTMNDSIVCYAAQGDTPRELWATHVGFGYEHAPSMQVEKEGVMFGSTKEGLIFALEGKTGKVLWKHKIGNSLISTVVPLNGHEVLFTATSGETGLPRIKN